MFDRLLKETIPAARVHAYAAPLLVPLIEDGRLQKPETRLIVKKYLDPLKVREVDTLIMGCNYYGLAQPLMQRKIGKRARMVDCASAVAAFATAYADRHMPFAALKEPGGSRTYFLTDLTDRIQAVGRNMYGRNLAFLACEL